MSRFDSFPDPGELLEISLGEAVEEVGADRRQVRRGCGLQLRATGVRDRELGGAGVADAALSLDQAPALEVHRDARYLTGAEANSLGKLGDADRARLSMHDVHQRFEHAQRQVVLTKQPSVERAEQGIVDLGQPPPDLFLVLGEEGANQLSRLLGCQARLVALRRGNGAAGGHDRTSTATSAGADGSLLFELLKATSATSDATSATAAAIKNASCRPPTWAASGVDPEATRSLARWVTTMPTRTATPSAPPICTVVLRSPEAIPLAESSTLSRAAVVIETKQSPAPRPRTIIPGSTSVQ